MIVIRICKNIIIKNFKYYIFFLIKKFYVSVFELSNLFLVNKRNYKKYIYYESAIIFNIYILNILRK